MEDLSPIIGGIGNVRKILFPEVAEAIFHQKEAQKQAKVIVDAYYSGETFGLIAQKGTWRAGK